MEDIDMSREFSKSVYNSKAWKEVRQYCLMRDHYECIMCGQPAEEVHHKIHLTPANVNDVTITINPDNLICLCHDCHMKEHHPECKTNYEFDSNGMLVEKNFASPRRETFS